MCVVVNASVICHLWPFHICSPLSVFCSIYTDSINPFTNILEKMRVGAVNTLANRKKDDKGQVNRGTETLRDTTYNDCRLFNL